MGKSMGGRARSGYARNVDVEKLRLDERRPFRDSPLRRCRRMARYRISSSGA